MRCHVALVKRRYIIFRRFIRSYDLRGNYIVSSNETTHIIPIELCLGSSFDYIYYILLTMSTGYLYPKVWKSSLCNRNLMSHNFHNPS